MHYMCSAPKLQCTKYEPNRALSSQGFSYTEIQPFGATGATYGQKCLFYGIFGPFLTPMEDLGAISVGPNGPNGPSWMYPTQIQPRSTEIQPFGDTGATYGHKCAFYGIFGPFLTSLEAPRAISVGPNGPNGPSWMYPTQIQPRSTEIQPFGDTGATYGQKCLFYGIFGPFLTPLPRLGGSWGNFNGSKWPQRTILDVSHPDPTKIH